MPSVLPEPAWLDAQARHEARVDALLAEHLARASRREKHPVEDFLFSYYSLRPAQLRRWHPGTGVVLLGPAAQERLAWRDHRSTAQGGVTVDDAAFLARRGETVRYVRRLLVATASRPAQLGCFGLHEWAMVYRTAADDVRHAGWPLRLGAAGTDAVVEGHRIRCSHHDAFRFFTAEARPLNQWQPRREDQVALEQPGCLHATMDLYKWAHKLLPAVPSELVADTFELARDVREVDMRASPYDLSALGHDPIPIETAAGKAAYAQAQRGFAARGEPLRERLLEICDRLVGATAPVREAPRA
jgi:hypothetical protein